MTSTSVLLNNPSKSGYNFEITSNVEEDLGLSDAVLKVAEKELRENKNAREQCLKQFREWIQKNEDIGYCRLDDRFLLRFLRVRKFSVPMAQQSLLKYLNIRTIFRNNTTNLDFLSPVQNEIINNGYIFASPVRDKFGRRVIIFSPKFLDTSFPYYEQGRAHFITYETLLDDPENQVLGLVHVGDFAETKAAHITNWNPSEFTRLLKWGEQSVPMRLKGIHLVHVPAAIKWVLDIIKKSVTPKMKDRFFAYVTMEDLHKNVDPSVLPQEMGGDIPMKDMIELWKRELQAKRDVVLALDRMQLFSSKGILSSRDKNNNGQNGTSSIDTSLAGSFRKLEFD